MEVDANEEMTLTIIKIGSNSTKHLTLWVTYRDNPKRMGLGESVWGLGSITC